MYEGLLLEVFGASKKVLSVEVFKASKVFAISNQQGVMCVCVCVCMYLASWKQAVVANSGIEEKFETLVWTFTAFVKVCFHMALHCLFVVPYKGIIDKVFLLGLPDLTIVQNPHAHYANDENHYVMERAWYRPCGAW
jgi:hypothetical protein